jgi:lipid phosphate phosphatase-related protein type 1/2/5
MYFIKSTRESLIAEEKMILTGDCCYLSPLLRRIIRFIGELQGAVLPKICLSK